MSPSGRPAGSFTELFASTRDAARSVQSTVTGHGGGDQQLCPACERVWQRKSLLPIGIESIEHWLDLNA